MSIRVMEVGRQKTLLAHIGEAVKLSAEEVERIGQLAKQLHDKAVLPVVGAGASHDCGVRLAKEIAGDLFEAYKEMLAPETVDPNIPREDLARIADAIYLKDGTQSRVVKELGIPDPTVWLPAEEMGPHFCVYSVLARMVRERILVDAFGFNYDCGAEAALCSEGIATGDVKPGQQWIDRARIVADPATNTDFVMNKGSFTLFKANGCAAKYRELAIRDEPRAAETIVVRTEQINSWKESGWSLNQFRSRAENHILLLIGFAAEDPKFSVELRQVLKGVYKAAPKAEGPRVVAIDRAKQALEIDGLIRDGLNGSPPADGVVTRIRTEGSTSTAALSLLLTEMLALALSDPLEREGATLPSEVDARLALLTVSAPAMRRWSYLVDSGSGSLIQRANQIARRGYVPLTHVPEVSARSIVARRAVRQRLGQPEIESAEEAARDHGFLVDRRYGVAYMPIGIDHDTLTATCRPGSELEMVRSTLSDMCPPRLGCILVSGDGSELRGVNLQTGKEVSDGQFD
ncbi:MAG: SIR2 family protein [Actinobacteria bacterium]|nr:SIR2 family protein [Actinomycetota bacterium]